MVACGGATGSVWAAGGWPAMHARGSERLTHGSASTPQHGTHTACCDSAGMLIRVCTCIGVLCCCRHAVPAVPSEEPAEGEDAEAPAGPVVLPVAARNSAAAVAIDKDLYVLMGDHDSETMRCAGRSWFGYMGCQHRQAHSCLRMCVCLPVGICTYGAEHTTQPCGHCRFSRDARARQAHCAS